MAITKKTEITENTDTFQTKAVVRTDKPWLFKKGQSGNPAGKPKGAISPIRRVKQIFLKDPNAFKDFIEGYIQDPNNRKHIVEMIDGKPKQGIDITSGGVPLWKPTEEEKEKARKAFEDLDE
jgi:hypothetical protein